MMQIIFKNMDRSELAKEAVMERMSTVLDRFPDLQHSLICLTLEMHNSPVQAGPDLFSVAVHVKSGRYRGIRLTKSASNLYIALADLVEHLLEKFNRHGDRTRVKARSHARGLNIVVPETAIDDEFVDMESTDSAFHVDIQQRS